MNISPTKNKLALMDDARKAGYVVSSHSGHVDIVKRDRRGRLISGIVVYENGTAFDATVDLSVARGIRSYAAMRKVLGI
jgi:hypothetical protein